MSKSAKFAKILIASAVVAVCGVASAADVSTTDNWSNPYGLQWKNGDTTQCWRGAFWTPATAAQGCDGAVVAQAPAPAPAPAAEPAAAPAPAPAPAAMPVSEKVTYSADAFFDFDKAVLKPAGKEALDDLAAKIKGVDLETVISTGFTDSFGSVAYNKKLSMKRAEAVRSYLVDKGVPADKIYVEGKGKTDFRVDPKSCHGNRKARIACQQPNRRTVVEIVGSHQVSKQ